MKTFSYQAICEELYESWQESTPGSWTVLHGQTGTRVVTEEAGTLVKAERSIGKSQAYKNASFIAKAHNGVGLIMNYIEELENRVRELESNND